MLAVFPWKAIAHDRSERAILEKAPTALGL